MMKNTYWDNKSCQCRSVDTDLQGKDKLTGNRIYYSVTTGVNSLAQDPLAQDSVTSDFYLQMLSVNSPRSQKTQLTRDMYIFQETVLIILYTIRKKKRKVSSMKVQIVGY